MGRPAAELERIAGEALPPARLAQIWRTLNEGERLGFIHSLDETIADLVIELTMPAQWLAEKGIDHARQDEAGQ